MFLDSSRYQEWPIERKIYVGNLPDKVDRDELEDAFRRYGRVENIWVARNPPGFAFILMDDERDAREACRELDGTGICGGGRVRVEMSRGVRAAWKRGGPMPTAWGPPGFYGPYGGFYGAGAYGAAGGYGGYGGGSRNEDRDRRRRSRSRSRGRRSRRSRTRSRSRSRDRRRRSDTRSRSGSHTRRSSS